jgi:hypothetical protein
MSPGVLVILGVLTGITFYFMMKYIMTDPYLARVIGIVKCPQCAKKGKDVFCHYNDDWHRFDCPTKGCGWHE